MGAPKADGRVTARRAWHCTGRRGFTVTARVSVGTSRCPMRMDLVTSVPSTDRRLRWWRARAFIAGLASGSRLMAVGTVGAFVFGYRVIAALAAHEPCEMCVFCVSRKGYQVSGVLALGMRNVLTCD